MDPVLAAAVKTISRLIQLGIAAYDSWKGEGLDTKELGTLPPVLDFIGDLGGGRSGESSADMAALQLGIITRCFGQAFGRHWAFNKSLAPTRLKRFRLFMSKEEKKRAEEIELRVRLATESLRKPGDLPTGAQEWKLVQSLSGSPLSTPYFQSLWNAFSDPKLDDEGTEPPLLDLGESGRMEFERHFLLAYHQTLASPAGQPLRHYLQNLHADYRRQLLQEFLLKDMAAWGARHTFGNIERRERRDDDPLPFMPLEDMYVEPDAGVGKGHEQNAPVLDLIHRTLEAPSGRVLVVQADFGMGKSLTARTLACRLAQQFLRARTPSPDMTLPVFVRCADDVKGADFDLKLTVQRAWQRQAKAVGLELKASDEALVVPDSQRAVFLLDGLDEISLGETGLKSFFQHLQDSADDRHRFIVFSRPGALPHERDLKGIPVLDLRPWGDEQIAAWLHRWRELKGGEGPTVEELDQRSLIELARTPILLLMIAQTWSPEDGGNQISRARLYEDFFRSIARGKHEADYVEHRPVYDAAVLLRDFLVEQKLLDESADPPDAMLWLMSRVAWEAMKLEQKEMLPPDFKPEPLKKRNIDNLLYDELQFRHQSDEIVESIQVGLLLTLQAHLRAGESSQILFGHKSFREFLAARYWADRLKTLARSDSSEWKGIELPLLGGRLLGLRDETFRHLMDMLNAEPMSHRPSAPFGLAGRRRNGRRR